ncbi:Mitogen-activated protein kinase kinase kinase 3 [Clydaea vesicula]|uniref:Mitogen-activated protein kinase kinase kinase 3 n=1 Tax=Clydaea vesicula TaxID=447962 RepID=A0AAD5TXH1_9FUNG|nr:Mitogen-activated protein kinase kinase kinase 3 [Clydaea vesicula]
MDGIVKITDFGVSKQLEKKDGEEDAAYNVRSSLNSIRGTPSWMAPEIVDQHGYSAKVDIWSFGCVMLEMLSGHKPWDQFNNELQIFKQLGQKNSPELPSGISDDALSMMKKHPYVSGVDPLDQNYFNFSEFLRKVEEEYQIRKAKEMEEYSDSNSDEEHNVEEDEEYCTEEIAEASEEDSIYESEEIIEEN